MPCIPSPITVTSMPVSRELSEQFFHPFIVHEIVSYFKRRELPGLLRISRPFYDVVASILFQDIWLWKTSKSSLRREHFCLGTNAKGWVHSPMLRHTRRLVVKSHSRSDCKGITASSENPEAFPLVLPQLDTLVINNRTGDCADLNCPLLANLFPLNVRLCYDAQHRWEESAIPSILSKAKRFEIELDDRTDLLGNVAQLPLPSIRRLRLRFSIKDTRCPKSNETMLQGFGTAVATLAHLASCANQPAKIKVIYCRETWTEEEPDSEADNDLRDLPAGHLAITKEELEVITESFSDGWMKEFEESLSGTIEEYEEASEYRRCEDDSDGDTDDDDEDSDSDSESEYYYDRYAHFENKWANTVNNLNLIWEEETESLPDKTKARLTLTEGQPR